MFGQVRSCFDMLGNVRSG